MVWVLVVGVVVVSLVALAVALLRAYRAGKALAREVSRASQATAPLQELQVGRPAAATPPLSEDELRARETALLAREAELEARLRAASSGPGS